MCIACIQVCNAIGDLTKDKADTVTIVAANAEYFGPERVIYCNGNWTGFEDRKFEGETILHCLEQAVEAKKQTQ